MRLFMVLFGLLFAVLVVFAVSVVLVAFAVSVVSVVEEV